MKFGDKLVGLRKKNRLSQEELAEKLGVSRQSVSKWESNNAYPETDKIVQICNLFDCSMDDLINDQITDLKQIERKEKNNITTYIDSFLEFITKTINMFGDMKFSSGLKCVIEMIIVGLLLALLGHILVGVSSTVISNLFSMLKVYNVIHTIVYSILAVVWFIIEFIILVHTFKIRYLNYYDKAKEEKKNSDNSENNKKEKIDFDKKENVVIRDGKDRPFAFLSVLSKIAMFFIKLFLGWISLILLFTLVGLSTAFILSVIHIGLGSLFVGLSITTLSGVIGTLSLLVLIIKFIFNKKNKSNKLLISFLLSIVFFGIGIGISIISFKNYKIEEKSSFTAETIQKLKYEDGLVIQSEYLNDLTYEFDETKGDDIELQIKYNDKLVTAAYYVEDYYGLKVYVASADYINNNFYNTYKIIIDDLKNNKIRYYNQNLEVKVVSSKATIDKLLENESKAYNYKKDNAKNGYSLTGISHRISMYNNCYDDVNYNAKTGELNKPNSCTCEKVEKDNQIEINCY